MFVSYVLLVVVCGRLSSKCEPFVLIVLSVVLLVVRVCVAVVVGVVVCTPSVHRVVYAMLCRTALKVASSTATCLIYAVVSQSQYAMMASGTFRIVAVLAHCPTTHIAIRPQVVCVTAIVQ